MDNNFDKAMRDAQFRKGISIAYFNAINSAISLITAPSAITGTKTNEETQYLIEKWRDYFLDEYAKFHAENIATIGVDKISPTVVEGLDKAKKLYESNKGDPAGK